MKELCSSILISIIICCSLNCCKNTDQKKDSHNLNVEKDEMSKNQKRNLCFRNEYPFQNKPEEKDVLELSLSIDDKKVTGIYNWLPLLKDQRKGSLKGKIDNNVIQARYYFSQEGVKDSTDVTITLESNKAIIGGGNEELGLSSEIREIDCKNF